MSPSEALKGSSPLARGLPARGGRRHGHVGIIPARAGFTSSRWVTNGIPHGSSPLARGLPVRRSPLWAAATDHPRSRGVYRARAHGGHATVGSSPLARGLLAMGLIVVSSSGIIPARAGFTAGLPAPARVLRDHPRSRGVYADLLGCEAAGRGSSPLARGLHDQDGVHSYKPGIIPARAGFTCPDGQWRRWPRDHPRSRGVYSEVRSRRALHTGSSPLARGLPRRGHRARPARGIIPARAGFTTRAHARARGTTDHPRSRGVYADGEKVLASVDGSSPLARGLRPIGVLLLVVVGIIPARAGFTTRCSPGRTGATDHPRSRGVYANSSTAHRGSGGSSPLARGLHLRIVGIPTNP